MLGEFTRSLFKKASVFSKHKEKKHLKKPSFPLEKSQEVQLYDKDNINSLVWPNTTEGSYIRAYFEPIIKNGIKQYCENIDGNIYIIKVKDSVFPVLVPQFNSSNSYVCSPFAHYITYGKEINSLINTKMSWKISNSVINCFEKIWSFGNINDVVYINNFLFSTDLHSKNLNNEILPILTSFLSKRFPNHTLVLRSINEISSPLLIKILNNSNWNLLASRYVFFTQPQNEGLFKTRIIKSDIRVLQTSGLQVSYEANEMNYQTLLQLYHSLYIKQHSTLNPQMTLEMLRNLNEKQLMHFIIVSLNQTIKGVAGYIIENDVMHCPFFGYEKTDSDQALIYRALNTSLLLEAKKRNVLFHQSAGASFYKSIRRAVGTQEYMAIYTKHLSSKQKASWGIIRKLINTFGPKSMKKY